MNNQVEICSALCPIRLQYVNKGLLSERQWHSDPYDKSIAALFFFKALVLNSGGNTEFFV